MCSIFCVSSKGVLTDIPLGKDKSSNQNTMNNNLKQCIEKLLDDTMSQKELTFVAHYCHRMSTSLIKKFYQKNVRYVSKMDYTIDSFAWRCIGDLFIPVEDEPCFELKNYFKQQSLKIDDLPIQEIEIALRKIISKKINQTIQEVYAELDPDFGRILRNVVRHVKHSQHYRTQASVFGLLVHHKSCLDDLLEKIEFPSGDLMQLLIKNADKTYSTPQLVDALFDILLHQCEFRRILPLMTIVSIIRDYHYSAYDSANADTVYQRFDFDDERIESMIENSIMFVSKTVVQKYVLRGVYSDFEHLGIQKILRNALHDFVDSGMKTLADYHREQFPKISYTEYRKSKKDRIVYIFSIAKEHFIEQAKLHLRIDNNFSAL